MTTNEAKLQFSDLPREDQDRIAGAIARGEGVQWWVMGKWQIYPGGSTDIGIIYRIPALHESWRGFLSKEDVAANTWFPDWPSWCSTRVVLKATPAPKPAKDPNRPRPAHKLGLGKDDVVRHVGWQTGRDAGCREITVESPAWSVWGSWLQDLIDNPPPKGQRPLFIVLSRAEGGEA